MPFNDCHHTCECCVSGKMFEWGNETLKRMSFEQQQPKPKKKEHVENETKRKGFKIHRFSFAMCRMSFDCIWFDACIFSSFELLLNMKRAVGVEREQERGKERERKWFLIGFLLLRWHACICTSFHQKISYFLCEKKKIKKNEHLQAAHRCHACEQAEIQPKNGAKQWKKSDFIHTIATVTTVNLKLQTRGCTFKCWHSST